MKMKYLVLFLILVCYLNIHKSAITDFTFYPEEKRYNDDMISKSGEVTYSTLYFSDKTSTIANSIDDKRNGYLINPWQDVNKFLII